VIVVHGLWRAGRLALWAEDSAAEAAGPAQHPGAASTEALADTLGLTVKGAADHIEILLPTRGGVPLDSPELVRDALAEHGRGAVTLRAWQVPALEFEPDDAFAALRQIDPDRFAVGSTVRHLMQIAGFAQDLVVRGRLLPSVIVHPEQPQAVWRPVLTGADALWAQALALALPPATRANAEDAGTPLPASASPARSRKAPYPGGRSAAEVVGEAIDTLVDAAARYALTPASSWEAEQHSSASPQEALHGSASSKDAPRSSASLKEAPRRGAAGRDASGRSAEAWRSWLAALTGIRRTFTADPASVAELAESLTTWQRDAAAGRVRACFRLVEPAEEVEGPAEDGWRLEFLLQAADEPSLLIDAERVWTARGSLSALARSLDSPQETLLTELGRASRLYPDLDDALRTARPAMLDLDGEGAHRFLREGAPMLAGAGFGVMLPGWWSKPRARLGARLTSSSPTAPGTVASQSAVGLDAIVDYQWEVSLGEDALTEEELRTLVEMKTSLVRLRGQWVELDAKRLASALKMISATGKMTIADLLHAGLSTSDGPGGLPVVSVTADGPLGDLLSGQVERRLEPVPAPDGFSGILRPYQERGLAWLSFLQSLGLGGILADDMGLGKTVQMLALLLRDVGTAPTLLVCPMSLVGNWKREAEKFAPGLRVHVHHGAERARGEAFTTAVADADLVITTYAIAARDAAALAEIEWHRLVVDEAQAIKNAATRQAVAVRALPARHRIAVTGTPVENRLADLWSIMEFANPGLLGTAHAFKARYAEPVERRGDEAAAERLKRLTGPFVLRRVKTDRSIISDLPDKIEMEVLCNLTAEQASLYQAVVEDMMAKIEQSEGIERRGLVLATMTKLKQVCNHPAHLLRDGTRLAGRSGKLSRLEEILDEVLASNEKALLFTQYAEFGGMLRAYLAARFGREVAFLHGGLAKTERDSMVARFQSDDPSSPPLFVLSLKAGGTGLTLTAANHVVHVDRWWNPAVEDQATDRAFRIGQKRNVQVRKFVCAGTVEEKISAMIQDKRGLAAKIVGTSESWITGLSTSDLRDLFALEKGAVVE
jgi:non-specific serine/threonine protein kinase